MHALDPGPALVGSPLSVSPRVLLATAEGGRSVLLEGLREHNVTVLLPPPGALLSQVQSGVVDLVLMHLPGEVALEQLEQVRRLSSVPVLVALREKGAPMEPFLEAGADDCVLAGVGRIELAARVRAVLRRRARPAAGEVLRAGRFTMDLGRHVFLDGEHPVHLPPKEFGLLELLIRRDGRVVGREEALALVWGGATGDPTTVDVHVKRLRSKVEDDPALPTRLLTVRGLGYRFQV